MSTMNPSHRIFVTGGTGFIGQALMRRLALSTHPVLMLVRDQRSCEGLFPPHITLLEGELGNFKEWQNVLEEFKPDLTYHLAWEGIPDYSFETSLLNLQKSLPMLQFLTSRLKCKDLVVTGSCWEYGKKQGACKESDPVSVHNPFIWAKNALHQYLELACRQNQLGLFWLRLFYVYGPKQNSHSLLPRVSNGLRNKNPSLDIRTPMHANDFIFVEDVAQVLQEIGDRPIEPGIYNLGSGTSTRVIEISKKLELRLRGNTELSDRLLQGNSDSSVDFWADTSRLRQAFSHTPSTTIDEGIDSYLAWAGHS